MLYKSKILTLVTIGYSCCIMMSSVIGPKWPFYSCYNHIGLFGTGFMQVMYLGRALRTKETLPDCLKWLWVTRQPLVFRGLTGSQRTPGFGASQGLTLRNGGLTLVLVAMCVMTRRFSPHLNQLRLEKRCSWVTLPHWISKGKARWS